jgi:hypothetical protein
MTDGSVSVSFGKQTTNSPLVFTTCIQSQYFSYILAAGNVDAYTGYIIEWNWGCLKSEDQITSHEIELGCGQSSEKEAFSALEGGKLPVLNDFTQGQSNVCE